MKFKRMHLLVLFFVTNISNQISAQSLPAYKAYYPLDGNISDSTGNTKGAKKTGGVYTSNRNGAANKALKYTGSKIEYVDLNDSFTFKTMTISIWLRPDSVVPSASPSIFLSNLSNITQFIGTGIEFYVYNNRKLSVLLGNVTNPPNSWANFTTKNKIPFNKWSHFACVIDSMKKIKLYINCKLDTSYNITTLGTFRTSGTMMHIGARANPHYENPFSGSLDELKIFDKALNDKQVTGIYKDNSTTLSITACNKYVYRGKTYQSSGTYTIIVTNSYGCDSTITLNLKINRSNASSHFVTACNSYFFNGKSITTSGVYYDTLKNISGCDSLLTFNITIKKGSTGSIFKSACQQFYFNGEFRTKSGIYTDTLINAKGCDSILTLYLTINQNSYDSIYKSACGSYVFNGINRNVSGIYYDTLINMNGCDSILTLFLTINNSNTFNYNAVSCENFFFNGKWIFKSGIYLDTLVNKVGCDSFISLKLTLNYKTSSSLNLAACDRYFFNQTELTKSGTYLDTIMNANGCDSLITLNLTINTVNEGVIQSANILTAIESNALYQWIDCKNGSTSIPNENKQSFIAKFNGKYAVIVSKSNCIDTSECYTVTGLGMNKNWRNGLQIFPNPNNGQFFIKNLELNAVTQIVITNPLGQIVYNESTTKENHFVSFNSDTGLFFLTLIESENRKTIMKFLKTE